MNTQMTVVISFMAYKLACLLVGAFFSLLGYKLFKSGIWGNAGELDTKFKDNKLVLKNAAPGTFFVVLGAAIIIVTLIQGAEYFWEGGASVLSYTKPELP